MIHDNPKHRTLVLLAVLVAQLPLMAQKDGESIAGEEIRRIHSRILEEERVLLVGLPDDYESTRIEYPVLYMLDGTERSFARALSDLDELREASQIPPMILVGITNTDRNRDMLPVEIPGRPTSGGADKFLRCLREEMIPFIEKNYRVSDFSILMGTSNTALFAIYTWINQPSTFDAYLASSPMIGHCPELIRSTTQSLLSRNAELGNSVYLIHGDQDSPRVTESVPDFVRQLRAKTPDGLRLEHVILPGEGHVPASSLTRGMQWIYSDFEELPRASDAN